VRLSSVRRTLIEHLRNIFENARNFQASIIKEKELDRHALAAIENKAAVFIPFAQLPDWRGSASEILAGFSGIVETVRALVDYDVDGVVFEVINDALRQYYGRYPHHHRWQIAYKSNVETPLLKSCRLSRKHPVRRVNPVRRTGAHQLSGAVISRATAQSLRHGQGARHRP